MPRNANNTPVDKLSNYSIEFETPSDSGIRTSLSTEIQLIPKASFSFWYYQTSSSNSGYILDNENTSPDGNSNYRVAFFSQGGTGTMRFVISAQSTQSYGTMTLPSFIPL